MCCDVHEHASLAQILLRGQRLAQAHELSVSSTGPQLLPLGGQVPLMQLRQTMPMPGSPPCGINSGSGTVGFAAGATFVPDSPDDLACWPPAFGHIPGQLRAVLSPLGSPRLAWAPVNEAPSHPSAQQCAQRSGMLSQKPCSTPGTRRCLCAALESSTAAGFASTPAATDGCSTPRGTMLSTTPPVPGAPRAAQPSAYLLPPPPAAAPAPAQGNPPSACRHFSTDDRSRLQEWLDHMELKLAVPPSPLAPIEDACEAPKVSASLAGCRPALTVLAAAMPRHNLDKPCSSAIGSQHTGTGGIPGEWANSHSSSHAGSITSTKKRTLPALYTTALLPEGSGDSTADAVAGNGLVCAGDAPCLSVHSRKRRSSCDSAGAAGPSPTASAAFGVDGMPAPAFVILGVLSSPEQLP